MVFGYKKAAIHSGSLTIRRRPGVTGRPAIPAQPAKKSRPMLHTVCGLFPLQVLRLPRPWAGYHVPQSTGQNRSGNDRPVDFFLIPEIIRKCSFVRVSHRSRSFLYGRFILRQNLHPTAQCRRGQRVRPPLSRAAFSGAGTTGSCPHQRCSFCRRPRGIDSGGGG